MNSISIGEKKIGEGHPCFVIAEAGVNHNGEVALAKRLIEVAANCGADAVKFQTFKAESLVTASAKMADYQVKNTGKEESQLAMLRRLELPWSAHAGLKTYAESLGLIFLSTPFDEEAIEFLFSLGVKAFKAGSGDLTNLPYLKRMALKGLPMILSTGMANLGECREARDIVQNSGNPPLMFLQCTTSYPCEPAHANLRVIRTLEKELDCPAGFSDHTSGITAAPLAVAAGAKLIEKHFTLDRNMEGPDHQASLEADELRQMILAIREAEKMLGEGGKIPLPAEIAIASAARKSVVAKTAIARGTLITADMLCAKRPGTGLHPRMLFEIPGKVAQRDIEADTLLKEGDFA